MRADKHYWKVTFAVFTAHVRGDQQIRIQRQCMGHCQDIIFEGAYSDLDKREHRQIRCSLEYELIGSVMADGSMLVIGIDA